jgi:hypothetical protein
MGRPVHRFAFLDMLLAASLALEGKKIRKPAKSRRSANELHRPGAGNATRRLGRGLVGVFVIHDRVSSNGPHTGPAGDMRCQHYRDVAGSLIFRNLRRGASPPICDQSPVIHDAASWSVQTTTAARADRRFAALAAPWTCRPVNWFMAAGASGRRLHSLRNAKRRKTGVGTVQPLTIGSRSDARPMPSARL